MFQSAPASAVRTGSGVGNSGGQADDELGARARAIAAGRDAAPVQLDQGLHQGEAESEPARAFLPVAWALPEPVEHSRQQLGGDPPAVVPHPQDDLPGFRPRGQPDVPARVGELGRVSQEVGQRWLFVEERENGERAYGLTEKGKRAMERGELG
jgi:hypothetical protein